MNRIQYITLGSKTQIADVTRKATKLKQDWAGHVSSEWWTKLTTEWKADLVGDDSRLIWTPF